jgi:hypothetical protein
LLDSDRAAKAQEDAEDKPAYHEDDGKRYSVPAHQQILPVDIVMSHVS